jgi:hypothetical protein
MLWRREIYFASAGIGTVIPLILSPYFSHYQSLTHEVNGCKRNVKVPNKINVVKFR